MSEQQLSDLIAAMQKQTQAQIEQSAAINRLAESNESLAAVLYQTFAEEIQDTTLDSPSSTYLSGKAR